MGERLLCKQEVVGSIPSGSTSGDPVDRDECSSVKMNSPTRLILHGSNALCVLSDIVKRRSFRANVCDAGRHVLRAPNDMRMKLRLMKLELKSCVQSAKLDRLVVGSILKQEMVFLISVRSVRTMSSFPASGRYISCCWDSPRIPSTNGRGMGIDNESDQVS